MAFSYQQKVLFKHCDPAGLVFYPRYFEMINDVIEAFFDQRLGLPFEELHKNAAVPTVKISTEFTQPSRHGDVLEISLSVSKLGSSSVDLKLEARCAHEIRLKSHSVLVYVDATGKPASWPDILRTALTREMETS